MLRIISFGLDSHWRDRLASSDQSSNTLPNDYRKRVASSLAAKDYSWLNFLAYALYPPLYIAGPIITFNDFIWQVRRLRTLDV